MTDHPPTRAFPKPITALVVLSVTINVVVAVAVGVLAAISAHLSTLNAANTTRIHDSQLQACRYSNITRVQDIAIWNRLLNITPAQRAAESPSQRAEVAQLEHLVRVKDTPVNCARLYHG